MFSVGACAALHIDDVMPYLRPGDVVAWTPGNGAGIFMGRGMVFTSAHRLVALHDIVDAVEDVVVRTLTCNGPGPARAIATRLHAAVKDAEGSGPAMVVHAYMRLGLVTAGTLVKRVPAFDCTWDLLVHGDLDASLVCDVQLGPDVHVNAAAARADGRF